MVIRRGWEAFYKINVHLLLRRFLYNFFPFSGVLLGRSFCIYIYHIRSVRLLDGWLFDN